MFGDRDRGRGGFGGRDRRGGGRGRGGFGGGRGRGGFGGGRGFGGRGGGRGFRERKPAPINVGEEYDVTIKELTRRGDGITRVKNFVVFVAGTKPGDNVKIKITEIRGNHGVGEVIGQSSGEGAPETEEIVPAEEQPEVSETPAEEVAAEKTTEETFTDGDEKMSEQNIEGKKGEAV